MLHEFRYLAPRTAAELLEAVEGEGAAIIAGGTDLLPNIRNGVLKPRLVVDVKKLPDAARIAYGEDGLELGPAVTLNDVLRSRDAREKYPAFCACAHELASHQVRNRATVVGNVMNASPCSDTAPALLCLGARAIVRSKSGVRELPFEHFFAGPKKTRLEKGEFVEKVVIPAASAGAKGRYLKLKRIAGHDLGIVGVLMVEKDGGLSFAVSSAAPTPVLATGFRKGVAPDEAAAKVLAACSPITDVRATKEYREFMIGVYVRRLLSEGV